jgi:hypothetical protein
MRARALLFVLIPVLLFGRGGRSETIDAKERRARTACLAGDYAVGVRMLSELFVATEDAIFIYNQGRCFEQNRRYEDAIARFQEFLRAGKRLTKADKAEARKHIDDCKELLASEKSERWQTAQAAPVAPPPAATTPAPPALIVATPASPPERASPSASGNGGSSLRTAAVATASVGAAALVAGIILNLKVNGLANDLKQTDGYSADRESDRKTYQTLGWVSYGVGAACLATGTVLYVLGLRSRNSDAVVLAPAFAPGQAGAVVKGTF